MLYYKAFHIISMVAWFAGLFYLPRLYVYHSDAQDLPSIERFKIRERRLYYGIIWPAGILTTLFGLLMIYINPSYLRAGWMHFKLLLVLLLWIYHLSCGHFLKRFANDKNIKSSFFYRVINEIPTVFLVSIVVLAVVKPI